MEAAARGVAVLALSGGVGGAKLACGLAEIVPGPSLAVAANPGDDFVHLGLTICPDLDTLMYSLAGIANPCAGWGLAGETWRFMGALERLGGEAWFQLGDADLATHVERTRRLHAGESLSAITDAFRRRHGIACELLPATDDRVRTVVETADGALAFQHYFVRERCEPVVTGLRYDGARAAAPLPRLLEILADPVLEAIVVCPSNPYLSLDPMLAIPGLGDALAASSAPVVAVSPVVAGASLKGPTAKIMAELGHAVSVGTVVGHYEGLLDGIVVDERDAVEADRIGCAFVTTDVVMSDRADRVRVARAALDLAAALRRPGGPDAQ